MTTPDDTIRKLRTKLVEVYPLARDAQRIAHDAHIPSGRIDWSGSATDIWHAVLSEAQKHDLVGAVVELLFAEYPASRRTSPELDALRDTIVAVPLRDGNTHAPGPSHAANRVPTSPVTTTASHAILTRVPTVAATARPTREMFPALTILHLSDVQFGRNHRFGRLAGSASDARLDTLLQGLVDDLDTLARDENLRPDVVALTGDLAEWGLKREFDDVHAFCEGLRNHLGLESDRIVVVPGNHDINRKKCEAYFADCEGDGEKPAEPYWPKWKPYVGLFDTLYKGVERYRFTEREPWTLYEIPELRVVLAGMNSTMRESHRDTDHYGWIGDAQLRWFADKLKDYENRSWLRVGLVHHNVLRHAENDDENLRDADRLRDLLGDRLNLLLHGHRHEGRAEMLGLTLPVLSTGSASLKFEQRPDETPNQYQVIQVHRRGFEVHARQYTPERRKWIGDTRVSKHGDTWHFSHTIGFDRVEATLPESTMPLIVLDEPQASLHPLWPHARDHDHESDDLLARVGRVARLRAEPGETRELRRVRAVGSWGDHLIVTCTRGIVFEVAVGVFDGALTEAALNRWCAEVHEPFVRRSPGARSELVIDGAAPRPELCRLAQTRGVRVATLAEYQGLIDFSDYLTRQNQDLASNELYPPNAYVRQRIAHKGSIVGRSDDAAAVMADWSTHREKRFTLVLGDFGAGKTFLMREVARRLGDGKAGVVPLLIEMRELNKASTLGALIMSHLSNHGLANATLESFYYMLDAGMVVLLFDGFDELATRISYDAVLSHFATLTEAAARGRVIVSTRTQFFKDARHVDTALMHAAQRQEHLVEVSLLEFTSNDVRDFLLRRYRDTERTEKRLQRIHDIHDLLGLSHNPRMLGFIADLPDVDLDVAMTQDGTITSAQLYDMLIERWLKFEHARQSRGDHTVPASIPEMRAALLDLACTLWRTTERTVPASELKEAAAALIERIGKPTGRMMPALKPDEGAFALGSSTMLVRDGDGNFGFIHQSVLEWFVAREAADEIVQGGATTLLGTQPLSDLMADFVWGLASRDTARAWAESMLRRRNVRDVLDANLRKLLARMGVEARVIYDGRHRDLRAGDLSGVSLVGAMLDGADLRGVDLSGRDLTGASLLGAKLAYANLRGARLTHAKLDDADLEFAALDGAAVEEAEFSHANLLAAKLLAIRGALDRGSMRHAESAAWSVNSQTVVVLAGASPCSTIAYSPDGLLVATGHNDGTVRLWDAQRELLLRVLSEHTREIRSVAWCPDGTRLASGSDDKTVRIWQAATGKELHVLTGHSNWVWNVAWSPDGTRLASASYDKTVRIWEASTGRELRVVTGHIHWVRSVAWCPDGTRLASGSEDKTVRIWETSTGKELRTLSGHTSGVWSVAWNPDGTKLASGSADSTVLIWQDASDVEICVLTGHSDWVRSVAWNPDGTRLASGSHDKTVLVWETITGKQLCTLTGHEKAVRSVAWSPDGSRLASGSSDEIARLWEAATGRELRNLVGHTNQVGSVVWSPNGRCVASGSDDNTVRLWDTAVGGEVRALKVHANNVWSVAWSPDGTRLASGSADRTVRLWDIATGRQLCALQGHTNYVRSVAWSPGGTRLASGSGDNTVRLWDAATGAELRVLTGHANSVLSVAWAPDGTRLATASSDETVRLWEPATDRVLRTLTGHTNKVGSVVWSPDGNFVASGSDDNTVCIWEAATGKRLRALSEHTNVVWSIAWSPEGSRLASGSSDKTVRIWEVATGRQLAALRGHLGAVLSVSWRRMGRHVVSSGDDGTVRIWDTSTGECLAVYMAMGSGMVVFRPRDGRYRTRNLADRCVWHTIGLARYELGELDAYVEGGLRLDDGEELVPPLR